MNGKEYRCNSCKKYFGNFEEFDLHAFTNTPQIDDPCIVCDEIILNCASRKKHLETHPKCKKCKIHFKSESFIAAHKIIFHCKDIPRKLINAEYGIYICYLCDATFADEYLAEIHVNSTHFLLKTIVSNIF